MSQTLAREDVKLNLIRMFVPRIQQEVINRSLGFTAVTFWVTQET